MRTWMDAYFNLPDKVDCIPRRFIDKADHTHQRARHIDVFDNRVVKNLFELYPDINQVVQNMQSHLNKVYGESLTDYKEGAKAAYKLVDTNLRHYRKEQIQPYIDNMTDGPASRSQGQPPISDVQGIKNGYITLLKTIKNAIHEANEHYTPKDEYDPNLVYLVELAYAIEIKLRFFANHRRKMEEEGDVVDYYKVLEGGDKTDFIEQIQEQAGDDVSEFVKESEKQMEEQLQQDNTRGR